MAAICAFVSFRLGLTDGVSVVAESWRRCFDRLGWTTVTVAADGPVDRTVPGLGIDDSEPPDEAELAKALDDADLVVAENILTIPLNLGASRAVAAELAGRPAILHHHDPPWQRERFAHIDELPPVDPAWTHVTINRFTQGELAARGIEATTIYNGFDTSEQPGDRAAMRAALGIDDDACLVLHPVRAIPRKNVRAAIRLVESLGGVYWLPGPAEEGYQAELDEILSAARCHIIRTPLAAIGPDASMADAYAGCDLVAFPSQWEGFGNPPIEAAIHRCLVAVGNYPAAEELSSLGFQWLDAEDHDAVADALGAPDQAALDGNKAVVEKHLSLDIMAARVEALLIAAGLTP